MLGLLTAGGLLGLGAAKQLGSDPTEGMPGGIADTTSAGLASQLKQVQDQSNRDEEDLIQSQLKNTREQANPFLASNSRFSQGLGGAGMDDAIQNKLGRNFERDYSKLGRNIRLEAPGYRMQRLATPMEAFAQQANLDIDLARARANLEAEKYAARANTVRSVLGFAGTIAGAGLGAGMAGPGMGLQGAAAGGQFGGGLGGPMINNPYSKGGY